MDNILKFSAPAHLTNRHLIVIAAVMTTISYFLTGFLMGTFPSLQGFFLVEKAVFNNSKREALEGLAFANLVFLLGAHIVMTGAMLLAMRDRSAPDYFIRAPHVGRIILAVSIPVVAFFAVATSFASSLGLERTVPSNFTLAVGAMVALAITYLLSNAFHLSSLLNEHSEWNRMSWMGSLIAPAALGVVVGFTKTNMALLVALIVLTLCLQPLGRRMNRIGTGRG